MFLRVIKHSKLTWISVYVSQSNQTFKINLRYAILSDAKAITSLTRKISIQKSNSPQHVDQTKLASVTSSTIRSRLMKFTFVEQSFVESVEALTSEKDSIPPVKRRRPSTPTPAVTLPPPLLKQIETSPEEASSSKETRLLNSPPSVCLVCLSGLVSRTVCSRILQLGTVDQHDERKMPIVFQGRRSKVKFVLSHSRKTL